MRIPDRIEVAGANLQKTGKVKAGEEKVEGVSSKDQVTVSAAAKEIGRLQMEVSRMPEIRTDKVKEIKNAIDAGAYNVKGESVAGKILKEAIIDSTV
jgi:negative regulator of flagellin synthesis FlgM